MLACGGGASDKASVSPTFPAIATSNPGARYRANALASAVSSAIEK